MADTTYARTVEEAAEHLDAQARYWKQEENAPAFERDLAGLARRLRSGLAPALAAARQEEQDRIAALVTKLHGGWMDDDDAGEDMSADDEALNGGRIEAAGAILAALRAAPATGDGAAPQPGPAGRLWCDCGDEIRPGHASWLLRCENCLVASADDGSVTAPYQPAQPPAGRGRAGRVARGTAADPRTDAGRERGDRRDPPPGRGGHTAEGGAGGGHHHGRGREAVQVHPLLPRPMQRAVRRVGFLRAAYRQGLLLLRSDRDARVQLRGPVRLRLSALRQLPRHRGAWQTVRSVGIPQPPPRFEDQPPRERDVNVSEPIHDSARDPCDCEHCKYARFTEAEAARLSRREESLQRNAKLRRLLRRSIPKPRRTGSEP